MTHPIAPSEVEPHGLFGSLFLHLAPGVANLFGLLGCSPTGSVDTLTEAKAIAQDFFARFSEQQFESVEELYGADFWKGTPKETWRRVLPNVYWELGAIEHCELKKWNTSTTVSRSKSGNYVNLTYECKHTKYESVISFTLFKPLIDGKSVIFSQNFSSLGLLLE